MKVLCQFPDCKKGVEIKEDMKYCPYCGVSFSLYGINIDETIKRERNKKTYHDKLIWRFIITPAFICCLYFIISIYLNARDSMPLLAHWLAYFSMGILTFMIIISLLISFKNPGKIKILSLK